MNKRNIAIFLCVLVFSFLLVTAWQLVSPYYDTVKVPDETAAKIRWGAMKEGVITGEIEHMKVPTDWLTTVRVQVSPTPSSDDFVFALIEKNAKCKHRGGHVRLGKVLGFFKKSTKDLIEKGEQPLSPTPDVDALIAFCAAT